MPAGMQSAPLPSCSEDGTLRPAFSYLSKQRSVPSPSTHFDGYAAATQPLHFLRSRPQHRSLAPVVAFTAFFSSFFCL